MNSARTNPNQYDRELKCVKNEEDHKLMKKTWVRQKITIKTLDGQFDIVMWTHIKKPDPGNPQAIFTKSKSLGTPRVMQSSFPESKAMEKGPASGSCNQSAGTAKDSSKTAETTEKLSLLDLTDPRKLAELAQSRKRFVENTTKEEVKVKEVKDVPKLVQCCYAGCYKKFRDVPTMKKHMKNHGSKDYICATCNRAFVDKSKLKRHHLVHTGEKKFSCEICNKKFSLEFNLRTHLKIHMNQRNFVCPIENCSKSFIQSTNLKSHIKTHFKKTKYAAAEKDNIATI